MRQTSLEGELGTRRRRERLELAPARVRAEYAEYKRDYERVDAPEPEEKAEDPAPERLPGHSHALPHK